MLRNRRARYEYHIEDTIEAGIALHGAEVKSIRLGNANLTDGYAKVESGEVWLYDVHIAHYRWSHHAELPPRRRRKLLLKKQEIRKLRRATEQKGYTLVPLSLYFWRGHAKVELGLGRGKHTFEKRQAIAERDAKRDLDRSMSDRHRE